MKACRLFEYGEFPRVDEVEDPEVTTSNTVLIKVAAAGVCRTDLHIVEGRLKDLFGVQLPYTLGHETTGRVLEVGSAVTHLSPGDAVILHPLATCGYCPACRLGDDMHCTASSFAGVNADGGMAEFISVGARAPVRLAADADLLSVAPLADAGLAAYHAIKKARQALGAGTYTAVIGSGGLGHIAIQLIRALTPATIIVIDPSAQALALAKQLGADHCVADNVAERVQDITNGAGVQAVFDYVGEHGTAQSGLQLLANRGTYYAVGYGDVPAVSTLDSVLREISIVGNLVGTYSELAELVALHAQGKIKVEYRTYPLEEATSAFHDLDGGRLRGRAVLAA